MPRASRRRLVVVGRFSSASGSRRRHNQPSIHGGRAIWRSVGPDRTHNTANFHRLMNSWKQICEQRIQKDESASSRDSIQSWAPSHYQREYRRPSFRHCSEPHGKAPKVSAPVRQAGFTATCREHWSAENHIRRAEPRRRDGSGWDSKRSVFGSGSEILKDEICLQFLEELKYAWLLS
jgi:hypothetical protein